MKVDDFKYWDPNHYEIKVVSGSEASCAEEFAAEVKQYPSMLYGTHVCSKEIDGQQYQITIKRFKTKELCKIHLEMPPTYVREGKTL